MNKKVILVILLIFACVSSAYLLISIPNTTPMRITSQEHLDEVIQQGLHEQGIANEHFRVYTAIQDSLFTRKVYQIDTPPSFSKTIILPQYNSLVAQISSYPQPFSTLPSSLFVMYDIL